MGSRGSFILKPNPLAIIQVTFCHSPSRESIAGAAKWKVHSVYVARVSVFKVAPKEGSWLQIKSFTFQSESFPAVMSAARAQWISSGHAVIIIINFFIFNFFRSKNLTGMAWLWKHDSQTKFEKKNLRKFSDFFLKFVLVKFVFMKFFHQFFVFFVDFVHQEKRKKQC
jgi:hypothetical protein